VGERERERVGEKKRERKRKRCIDTEKTSTLLKTRKYIKEARFFSQIEEVSFQM
jgi:hypothetical protein